MPHSLFSKVVLISTFFHSTRAHMGAFAKGMYCLNGTSGSDNPDTNEAVFPVYNLPESQWWMHHDSGCDAFPPAPGDLLELPAGGTFTVEIAMNRALTSLSYGGRRTTDWGDGKHHPEDYSSTNTGGEPLNSAGCLLSPNFHTEDQMGAAGTAFAISYESDIHKVTAENLVVFTVKYHTPWKRITTYEVPAGLPKCPKGGCHCVWGWLPGKCGQINMYIHPYKCHVTGSTSIIPLSTPAKPPVWCENDPSRCVRGAKQMIYWAQASGNNVFVEDQQKDGKAKSPGYNVKMGFQDGAQNDIFLPRPEFLHLQAKKRYERPSHARLA